MTIRTSEGVPMYNALMEAVFASVLKILASKIVILFAATGVTIAMLSHLKSLKFRRRGRHYEK